MSAKNTKKHEHRTEARADESKAALLLRLKRAEGQVSAVRRMVEEDIYCVDVLVQVAAVRGALDRIAQMLLEDHLQHCVVHAMSAGSDAERDEQVDELMDVFRRFGGKG